MDEATEFRDKYSKSAKKVNKMEVEVAELRRVVDVLKQSSAEAAADGDACTSTRTRLESEARPATASPDCLLVVYTYTLAGCRACVHETTQAINRELLVGFSS